MRQAVTIGGDGAHTTRFKHQQHAVQVVTDVLLRHGEVHHVEQVAQRALRHGERDVPLLGLSNGGELAGGQRLQREAALGRLHRQLVAGQRQAHVAGVRQRFQDVEQLARGNRGGLVVLAHAEIGMSGDLYFQVGRNKGNLVAFLAHQDVRKNGQGMASFDDARHSRQRFQQCIACGLYELHVHPFRVCSNTCRVWLSSACFARASEILRTACSTVV
ncbi:hypothetical protein D3C73_1023650 [compost metagenome]